MAAKKKISKKKKKKKTAAKKVSKKKTKAAPRKKKAKKAAPRKKKAKKVSKKKKAKAAPRKKAPATPPVTTTQTTAVTGMKSVPDGKSAVSTPASTKPLWQKLHVKGGFVRSMNVPAGYEDLFAGSPAQPASGNADTVHLWVNDHAELDTHLATASAAVNEGGMLLISYPKGRKDIHRDTLWKAVGAEGWEGVALVAVDDTWSTMRFKRK